MTVSRIQIDDQLEPLGVYAERHGITVTEALCLAIDAGLIFLTAIDDDI